MDMTFTLDEAKKEALRQSERHLEAQQALATAADQRSLAFCSAAIVISALLIGNVGDAHKGNLDFVILIMFIISAILSAFSAAPTRFYGSGGSAGGFAPYLNEYNCDLLLSEISNRNDDYIKSNDTAIRRSAWILRVALIIAFLAILLMLFSEIFIKQDINNNVNTTEVCNPTLCIPNQ